MAVIALQPHPGGVILPVRAQPGARRDALLGEHGGALKIAITQAPEKGKANRAIAELLCRTLNLRKGQLELIGGDSSRHKRFLVRGLTANELAARLAAVMR